MSIGRTIRANIESNVALVAIGNSERKMKDLAVDLINASGMSYEDIADKCYLCKGTIKNLATEVTKNPQSETLERIFRAFEFRLDLNAVRLNERFANKPKR